MRPIIRLLSLSVTLLAFSCSTTYDEKELTDVNNYVFAKTVNFDGQRVDKNYDGIRMDIFHFKKDSAYTFIRTYLIPPHNNQVFSEKFWKDGRVFGQSKVYLSNGRLHFLSHFVDGKRHGITEYYDEKTGEVTEVEAYENGQLIKSEKKRN